MGYLDEIMKPLVLMLPKMSLYVKVKDENKDNKLMSFCINDGKLLEKYKTIRAKIEALIYIKMNAIPVYDDRYIKNKIRTYGDKFYTNFCVLNVMTIFLKLMKINF